jgi:ATP-binding cassette subfamily B protein
MYIEAMRAPHDLGLWLMGVGMLVLTLVLWSRGSVTRGDVILTLAVAFRVLHGSRDLAFAVVNTSQFVARIAEAIQLIGEDYNVVDWPGARKMERGQRVGLAGPSGRANRP